MSVQSLALGCRLNSAEADTMAALATAGGLRDALIVNTCAVTAEAEAQARQAIRRAARAAPARPIIVTGCAATLDPARWAALPGVARVLTNQDKLRAESWNAPAAPAPAATTRRARAFLEVQQGCDHECSFCVIRIARGASRMHAPDDVLGAARRAVARGQSEVVLTGVDLASWRDDARDIAWLARAVLAVPGLARLRLSSLDPAAIPDALFELWRDEPRLAPSLHLSAQHGDGLVLKRMKRRHAPEAVPALAARLRAMRADAAISLDLIAGFPTETPAAHAASLALLDALRPVAAHVFPYSARPGTAASRMPALARELPRARAAELRAAALRHAQAAAQARLGASEAVIFETAREGITAQGLRLRATDADAPRGGLRAMRVTGREGALLLGEAETNGAA